MSTDDAASRRFRELAFRGLPLVALAAAAAVGAAAGPAWSERLAPVPWLVSLGIVGLPHGAADFAASRSSLPGRYLALAWLAYAAGMAAVMAGFAAAPRMSIVAFAAVSCWHFGAAHVDRDGAAAAGFPRVVAAVSRGCVALAVPLAGWPAAAALAATELATVPAGRAAAAEFFPAADVRALGFMLVAVSLVAAAIEGVFACRRPGGPRAWLRLLVDLAAISSLGWFTHPLFAVGAYFLLWHAWRQMEPLAATLDDTALRSWPDLGRAVVHVHLLALPLLVPAWVAIGAVWWRWTPAHTLRDLAIVSIGGYLVVTPAHELLGDLLRSRSLRSAAPTTPPLRERPPCGGTFGSVPRRGFRPADRPGSAATARARS